MAQPEGAHTHLGYTGGCFGRSTVRTAVVLNIARSSEHDVAQEANRACVPVVYGNSEDASGVEDWIPLTSVQKSGK